MKKLLLILLCLPFITFAQSVPQGINYQAVARDASGAVLMNQALTIQFSVISDIATSAVSWQETHLVTTNDYGLFTAIIGQGAATTLGSSATFDVVDWGSTTHFLKVEMDGVDMGTTQLMSVPYSIYSKNLIGCTDSTALNYSTLANTDDGSCIISGCTDTTATNYNALANTDDGSCAPTITSGGTGTNLVENSGAGQTVYTIIADANDGGTISSYDISGTDAGLLTLTGNVVTLNADPDYETKSSYSFTVTATDAAGTSAATTVTFSITNVDEVAPSMTITATEVNNNDTSNDPSLNLIFTSSESTSNFVVGDITVAGGTLSAFSGSGTTYTATFTPAAAGACTIDVLASAFTDAAGNNNTAADQFNWTYNSGYSKLRINDLTDLSNNFFYQNGYDNAGNTTSSSYMYYYIWVDATNTTASAGRANSVTVRVGSWASGWNAGQNSVISNYIQNITLGSPSSTNYGNVNWQITTTNPSSDYIEIELKNGGYFDGTEVIHVWLDETGSNNPDYGYDGRGTNTPLPGTGGIFSPWTSYITFIP